MPGLNHVRAVKVGATQWLFRWSDDGRVYIDLDNDGMALRTTMTPDQANEVIESLDETMELAKKVKK